jgi:hypothetical protein
MDLTTIIGGILTLAILSFLYRDNPVYRMAEAAVVGLSIGYTLVMTWNDTLVARLYSPLVDDGRLVLILPLALGLLMFARFHPRAAVWSRIPIGVLIGAGAGAAIPAMLGARTMTQMSATIVPLWTGDGGLDVTAIVILVGVLCTLAYFYFTHERRGALREAARVGTWFLMLFFGTTFGFTVMSRMSMLIGRVEFLLSDLLHLAR